MRQITLKQFTAALETIAKNVGAKGFEQARKSYESTVLVVGDDDGLPIDLSTVDIEIKSAADESEQVDETELATIVKSAVAEQLRLSASVVKANRGRIVGQSADDNAIEAKRISFPTGGHRVKHFFGASERENNEKAYRFGVFALAGAGSPWARERAKSLGVPITKAHTEGVNTAGGTYVPDEFSGDLIRLVEEYGVFRRNARVMPMSRDTLSVPRATSGLTAYFVGEAAAGTESTGASDRVLLSTKKLMVLTTASTELQEDSIIAFGDLLMKQAATAISYKEDDCGFNGDGTSTYGGIFGVRQRLSELNGVDDGGGLVIAGTANADTYPEVTQADIGKLMGSTPMYPGAREKFYCSKPFFGQVFQRLAVSPGATSGTVNVSGGGSSVAEMQSTAIRFMYLGVPVEIVQVMPKTAAASQICCLFGDLSLSSTFGDRRQIIMTTSDSALNAFEQDETCFKWTERFDIVNHDLGDASSAGPVVGLILTA